MENFDEIDKYIIGMYYSRFPNRIAMISSLLPGAIIDVSCLSGMKFPETWVGREKCMPGAIKARI